MRSLLVENDFDAIYDELTKLHEAEEAGEEALRKELSELEDEIRATKAKSKAAIEKAREIKDSEASYAALKKEHREYLDTMMPLLHRRDELKDKIQAIKADGPIDEEDIEHLCDDDRLILELEYDDLSVEVEGEFGGEPYDYNRDDGDVYYTPEHTCTGTLTETITIDLTDQKDWNSFDRWSELLSKFLKKPVDQIMRSDLKSLDFDAFNDFIKDWYEEAALNELNARAKSGDFDYDDVDWDDCYDYDNYGPGYSD